MLFIPSKCMQQIATLIITFAVYVSGIRNNAGNIGGGHKGNAGSDNVGSMADYESYSEPYNEDFHPSQQFSAGTEVIAANRNNANHPQKNINNRSDFRPSQLLTFTNSDAQTALKQYPPSYLESNYYSKQISKGGPLGLATKNKNEQHFVFPHGVRQESSSSTDGASADTNIKKYLYNSAQRQQYHQRLETTTQHTFVPAQLHTTPINIYRDPYTNKINTNNRQQSHYHSALEPALEPILYQQEYAEDSKPQEYTVQSMLVVGSHNTAPTYNQQSPHYTKEDGQNMRPGYVFNEQLKPSYNHPQNSPSMSNYADYNRRDGDTQTERPYQGELGVTSATETTTNISYDSHDYPPPSYYKQQTSNFQSPQRQDNKLNYQQSAYATTPIRTTATPITTMKPAISYGRPELTSSNYVNKFGNYLKDGGGGGGVGGVGGKLGIDGHYKRPSSHYSNDILYVTPAPPITPIRPSTSYYSQANEPLRRPPTYNNNYYQYQIGEIPPSPPPRPSLQQAQRFEEGLVQRPPPEQYYTTPQRYPPSENYQPTQNHQPAHSYPPSSNYSPSQNIAPPAYYTPSQNFPPPPPNYSPSQNYPPSFSHRPPRPQYQPTVGGGGGGGLSGLATLASLFTSTQQYAPQFASLLGGGGGGLLQALTGTRPSTPASSGRPPNVQLIKALENIARNDDLECVPKVLCNMIASQTQRGQLPTFITSPAITNFLAGFPAQSPALIYGRAALLGISGGERSCTQTYSKCPKNEYEILYYLNNHRGGFFKFFSESEEQPPTATQRPQQSSSTSGGGGTSLFSLLSALTGGDDRPVTTTKPRPTPPPTIASFDITQGIGNFFTNILSEYISGVEYQRRSSRAKRAIIFEEAPAAEGTQIKFPKDTDSKDFHDEEDDEDTQQSGEDFEDEYVNKSNESAESVENDDTQGRVVFKTGEHGLHFFPPPSNEKVLDENLKDFYLQEIIRKFNADKTERKLKFPTEKKLTMQEEEAHDNILNVGGGGGGVVHFRDENASYHSERPDDFSNQQSSLVHFKEFDDKKKRRGKMKIFKESAYANEAREEDEPQHDSLIKFPEEHKKHIRKGKILNRPIHYASHYDDSDHFVISDNHRPEYNEINEQEDLVTNNDSGEPKLGPFYQSSITSSQEQHSTQLQLFNGNRIQFNRGAETHLEPSSSLLTYSNSNSANYNDKHFSEGSTSFNYKIRPNYASSSSYTSSSSANRYNYPNTNYVSNNRYGNRYHSARYSTTTTTTRTPHKDDQNIYITNAQGVTTHYITPNGRKVNL